VRRPRHPGQRGLDRGCEQLVYQHPVDVEAGLHLGVRELGAVTQPDHPLRGVVAVVRSLLDALAAMAASTGSLDARSLSNSASRNVE